jgi:hypothetical protein
MTRPSSPDEHSSDEPGEPDEHFFDERPVERSRGRSAAAGLFVLVGVLLGLAVLAVIADVVVRSVVEQRAAAEIATATGADDVAVDVHGTSVLWQLVHGSIDDATVSSGTDGDPLSFRFDVSDVPTDLAGSTGAVTGELTVDAATVDALPALADQAGSLAFGDDEVTYTRTFAVPLIGDVPVDVTATPSAALPDTSLSLDLRPFLGDFATSVCVAGSIPEGVTMTSLSVAPEGATIGLESAGLPLSSSALAATGSCS